MINANMYEKADNENAIFWSFLFPFSRPYHDVANTSSAASFRFYKHEQNGQFFAEFSRRKIHR